MAIFSGKILTAHYIDPEYSIVELTYTGEDGGVYAHALRVDPNNPEWQALLEDGWDQDKLAEGTAEYKRQSSFDFNTQVNSAAKDMVKEMLAQETERLSKLEEKALHKLNRLNNLEYNARKVVDLADQNIYEHIISHNEDKDELFKFKLWALELEAVKNSDKEIKSKIRKVAKITEGIVLIHNILN